MYSINIEPRVNPMCAPEIRILSDIENITQYFVLAALWFSQAQPPIEWSNVLIIGIKRTSQYPFDKKAKITKRTSESQGGFASV